MELSDDDWELATKLRALSEAERELLMTALGPPQKPTAKKSSTTTRVYERCVRCGKTGGHGFHKDSSNDGYHLFQSPPQPIKTAGKKSARAAGMAATISNSLQRGRGVVTGDRDGSCANCDYAMDHNIHHLESMTGHHPFTPAAQSTELTSDQASFEIDVADVSSAAQGAGGGD